eukprot:scaffold17280_cov48-Cyclotella_meneghiniana.AAC.2
MSWRFQLDPTSISEGDLMPFDEASCRNLKMWSKMEVKNNSPIDFREEIPSSSSMSITVVSERDLLLYEQSALYGLPTELFTTIYVKIHCDMSLLNLNENAIKNESDVCNYLHKSGDKSSPLFPLTSAADIVSEGAILLNEAIQVNSVRLFQKSDRIESIRSSSSSSCSCCAIESGSDDLRLDEFVIRKYDKFKCKESATWISYHVRINLQTYRINRDGRHNNQLLSA